MKEIVEGLKSLARGCGRLNKLLNQYTKLKENQVENAYLLEKRLTEITKAAEALPNFTTKELLNNWIYQEKEGLNKTKEDFRFIFGQRLNELFQQDGIQIRGQYPTLRIGFYTVKLNFEFGEAAFYFGPEVEKIKDKISLKPTSIYEIINKYDNELKSYKFNPQEFFTDLYYAYRREITTSNKSMGEKILIIDVLHEFVILKQPQQFFIDPRKENFREYPRVKLSYFLYLLKKSDIDSKGLHFYVATFDATVDKKQAIWIPENEEGEGTYYSYISFEKVPNT